MGVSYGVSRIHSEDCAGRVDEETAETGHSDEKCQNNSSQTDFSADRPNSPQSVLDLDWELVPNLVESQVSALRNVSINGVSWTNPITKHIEWLTLHYGGEVQTDGNCLFSSLNKLLECPFSSSADARKAVVEAFLIHYEKLSEPERADIDLCIRNLYSADMADGWGVHVLQEIKLLAKKNERVSLDSSIDELLNCGMSREVAAEMVYKEQCLCVNDTESWCKYMMISGVEEDEYDIISLHYTVEGIFFVDENRDGRKVAFGDDIAIEVFADFFSREIFVLQVHGSDGMVTASDSSLFFLPHKPKGDTLHPPLFLFMKGTGWCGSGGDHYEPIIAKPRIMTGDKPRIQL